MQGRKTEKEGEEAFDERAENRMREYHFTFTEVLTVEK